jgi:hypothetical protein
LVSCPDQEKGENATGWIDSAKVLGLAFDYAKPHPSGCGLIIHCRLWLYPTVTVTIRDINGNALSGATVSLVWSDGVTVTCTTGTSGTCTVKRNNIGSAVLSLGLDVTGVALNGYTYDATTNAVMSIIVNKPK